MNFAGRQPLLDTIKGSIATLVLFLAFVTLPMLGLFPGIFVPLPGVFYSLKSGRQTGIAIVVITAAVLAVMADRSTFLLYLLQGGCISLTLPFFLGQGKGAFRSLAYTVAASLALLCAVAVFYGASRGVNLDLQVKKGIEATIAQTASFYEKAGLKGDELKVMQQGLAQAGHLIRTVYPALIIITLATMAGLNMLVLGRIIANRPGMPEIGSFRDFRNPEPLVWVLIAAGFAMLVSNPAVNRGSLNLLIVTLFMYLIQGLAVTAYLFQRLAVPRFVRIICYILLAVQPYLAIGLAVVGIFDIWGDFRTPRQPKNL